MNNKGKVACNVKNTDTEDDIFQKIENMDPKDLAAGLENDEYLSEMLKKLAEKISLPEDPVNVKENRGAEGKKANDRKKNCTDDADVKAKIAIFESRLSEFKKMFETWHRKYGTKVDIKPSQFEPGFLASEKGRSLFQYKKKMDASLSLIKSELKYWEDLSKEDLYTAIKDREEQGKDPLALLYDERLKFVNCLPILTDLLK